MVAQIQGHKNTAGIETPQMTPEEFLLGKELGLYPVYSILFEFFLMVKMSLYVICIIKK